MRSGLLFSIIVLAVFCTPVLAYDWFTNPGDGSEANPYQISTSDQFIAIGNNVDIWGKHFILMNDINLSGISNGSYQKIGDEYSTPFSGVFDGDNKTISGFLYKNASKDWVGLFGVVREGKIRNLTVKEVNVQGRNTVGGLVGQISAGELLNCHVEGVVEGIGGVGGVVGDSWRSTIHNCSASGEVSASHWSAGGIIGHNEWGEVAFCSFKGTVSGGSGAGGSGSNVGGLIGGNEFATISQCSSVVSILNGEKVGGLIGKTFANVVVNSYSRGEIQGDVAIGGLVGYVHRVAIKNCYSTCSLSGTGSIGGFIGEVDQYLGQHSHVLNSFWDIQTSGQTEGIGYGSAGGVFYGKATDEMMMASTFLGAGWDFVDEAANGTEDIWWIDEGNDYPRLWWGLNTPPVADAGAYQTVYAWVDGYVLVGLDGAGSYDADGDALEYYWYDANELIATGAEPNVLLPIGEHVVDLIVNDGIVDSEPNSCLVTVAEALEVEAKLTPQALNRKSERPHVIGRLELVGLTEADIDPNEPMVLMPGDIAAGRVEVLPGKNGTDSITLMGFFDNAALMEAIDNNPVPQTPSPLRGTPPWQGESFGPFEVGELEVTIAAKLLTGQWVYGRDVVTVK